METKHRKNSPYVKANCFSRLFYCWVDPILKQGSRHKIELEEIHDVFFQDSSDFLCSKLEKHWNKELKQISEEYSPSLTKALARSFGLHILLWSILFVLEEIVRIICPFMIGGVIKHFEQDSDDIFAASMYALGICICAVIPTIVHHPFVMAVLQSGMRMRVACCALVYKKMMKLGIYSFEKVTIGQVINIISNDVARFDLTIALLPYLLVGPLEVLAVSILLWFYIGWSGLCGMLVLLLVIPFTGGLAKVFSKLRSQTTVFSGKRLSLMTEVLNSIQLIKMFCWESYIEGLVLNMRNEEIKKLYKASFARGITLSTSFFSIKLIIFVTFLSYVLLGHVISAEVVFVTMSLYNPVKMSMTNCFPIAMQFTAETLITIKKIQDFLLLEERQISAVTDNDTLNKINSHLKATNLSISWSHDKTPFITNLSFDVRGNDLLMVVGAVGSGKSGLLLTILKELPFLEGEMNVSGRVAYVPQSPWVFNASVKSNIVMGSNYDAEFYKTVIKFSALERDLKQLPSGDETIVGERGMSLSGGQKARIGLARALYRNAEIYLMDAPLSAIDASVGHFLFHECINGFLAKKLRVLVTHQLQYLPHASKILVISKNQKSVVGNFQELCAMGVDFVKMFKDSANESNKKTEDGCFPAPEEFSSSKNISKSLGHLKKGDSEELHERLLSKSSADVRKTSVTSFNVWSSSTIHDSALDVFEQGTSQNKKTEDSMSSSTISFKLYWTYFKAGGGILACVCSLLLNILAQTSFLITDWWLAYWCQEVKTFTKTQNTTDLCLSNVSCHNNTKHHSSNETLPTNEPKLFPHTNYYLWVFALLSMSVVVLGILRAIQFFHMAISSSNNLHMKMLYAIIRSPMTFFVNIPSGQILNRFSKDLGQIDDYLPLAVFDLMQSSFLVLGVFVVIIATDPWIILALTPILICFVVMRNYFLKTFRNVKRLEAITKSPVFSHVNITFSGLQTIRCHGNEDYFIKEFNILQDTNTSTFSLLLFLGRWFAVRIEWMCTILVCAVAFACLIAHQFATGALVGLSLAYAMTLLVTFQWVVRQSTDVQGLMVLVERIHEYSKLPIEDTISSNTPSNWPEKGKIEFRDVTLSYKTEATEALHQVTFDISPGEKIGIVGRTGAGKSSLINVLFRLFDFDGEVEIDGVNHRNINLHYLRKNLSIIPQDPILFAGSIRSNLDPLSKYSDHQIWQVLNKVEMDGVVKEMKEGLYYMVQEGGTNMSVGQRQMLCMARALLENNKILIIDEATANVDRITDSQIQKKIKLEFSDCTVLSVAHRLSTVIDYDKIMILESGEIKDYGIPYILLQDSGSMLHKLAKNSGEREFEDLFEVAEKAYKALKDSCRFKSADH